MATKPKQPSLTDIAAQQVNTALAPVIAALNQQKTQTEGAAQDRAAFLKQLFEGVAQSQAPVAGQIEQTYGNAADRQAVFAKGYSDTMQRLTGQAADQSNALLRQNGSPQTVTDKGQQQADVLYGLGGYNPASVLNTSGAAFASAAKQLPGQARLQGGMYAASALGQGAKDAQTIQNQIMQTEAQRPGLLQSAVSGLQDAQFKAQQATQTQKNTDREYQLALAKFAEDKRQFGQTYALEQLKASKPDYYFFQGAGGGEYVFDKNTGGLTQITGNAPKTVAPKDLSAAKNFVRQSSKGYFAYETQDTKPLSQQDLAKLAKDAGMNYRDFIQDPNALTNAGVGYYQHGQHEDQAIQQIYLSLVRDYNIPARKAFDLVAQQYRQWGSRNRKTYFPNAPKAGAAAEPAAAASPTGAKQTAFRIAQSQYGWGAADLKALETLWNGESGWNYKAKNASSGALGIPQALGHTLPADYASNPVTQIQWGLNYIKQRYGSPSNALRFWLAQSPHWY